MKKTILTTIAIFAMNFAFSQTTFNIPDGYQTYKDGDGKESRADGDFDGDGVNDLAILCTNQDGTKIVVVYLASKWITDQTYWWFPWDYSSDLSYSNNVLTIKGGLPMTDGVVITLKLKYYPNLNNMKLIGYDKDDFMPHDGPPGPINTKSINLSTGEYQVNNGVKKKINIDLITLSNIEKYFDYLGQVGQNETNK